jgi:hypothetical protein
MSSDELYQPTDNSEVGAVAIKRATAKVRKYANSDEEFELFLDMIGLKKNAPD